MCGVVKGFLSICFLAEYSRNLTRSQELVVGADGGDGASIRTVSLEPQWSPP